MLDKSNDFSEELNFEQSTGNFGLDSGGDNSDDEQFFSNLKNQQSGDEWLAGTLDFTRVKLTEFSPLDEGEEKYIASQMIDANRSIALLIAASHLNTWKLLNLLEVAKSNTLDKSRFHTSERYFALRSELAHFVNGQGNAKAVPLLLKKLQAEIPFIQSGNGSSPILLEYISAVDWPGPLMQALANHLVDETGAASPLEHAIDEYFSYVRADINNEHQKKINEPNDQLSEGEFKIKLEHNVKAYLNARETLVKHNLRLVFHVTKRFSYRQDQMIDLIQEGALGLLRAAEKFRPAMGYRFSTYAYQWIESKIRRALVNIDRVISISPDYHNDLIRISKWTECKKMNGVQESTEVLIEDLGINKDRLDALMRVKSYSLSMDHKVSDEELSLHSKLTSIDSNILETITDENNANYISLVMEAVLTERECYVINERFGRLDSYTKTLQELSETLCITRERVRQIETAALEKLRARIGNQRELWL
jgi:RNA polymerase sigma factor (sigma-70 family)